MKRKTQPVAPFQSIAGLVVVLLLLPTLGSRCGGTAPAALPPTSLPVATADPDLAPSPLPTPTASPVATVVLDTARSPLPAPTEVAARPLVSPLEPTPAVVLEPTYTYRVVRSYPHDPGAFTQGLIYVDGLLYEGTGLPGRSSLRRVELESGEVLQSIPLDERYFGEGIAILGSRLYQLTWQEGVGFIYDWPSLERVGEWTYEGEGWGLTDNGTHLIMSDGTPTLRYLDPESMQVVRQVEVHAGFGLVAQLNELEYVRGEVYANLWKTDHVARIDPESGIVLGWIDLSGLLTEAERAQGVDVLNGIAYDAQGDRLFVTGKLWPRLFEIELERR